jgi:hypothetical protein
LNPDAQFGPVGAADFQGPSSPGDEPIDTIAESPVVSPGATGSDYLVNQALDKALDSWWRWA